MGGARGALGLPMGLLLLLLLLRQWVLVARRGQEWRAGQGVGVAGGHHPPQSLLTLCGSARGQ